MEMTMTNKKVTFKNQGKNRVNFTFRDNELFLKQEKFSRVRQGVVINLYQEKNGVVTLIKHIGWVSDGGHGECLESKSLIRGLTDMETCKSKVIDYLHRLLTV